MVGGGKLISWETHRGGSKCGVGVLTSAKVVASTTQEAGLGGYPPPNFPHISRWVVLDPRVGGTISLNPAMLRAAVIGATVAVASAFAPAVGREEEERDDEDDEMVKGGEGLGAS
eukprot:753155-Hanusia_phi.AAC.2